MREPHRHTSTAADERNCRIAAQQIEEYWHKQGHCHVRAWLEQSFVRIQDKQATRWWVTKTNLVNGLPP